MRSKRIEDSTRVCKISFQRENSCFRVWERDEVKVEDLVALLEEVRYDMTAGLSTTARKCNLLPSWRGRDGAVHCAGDELLCFE